MVATLLVFSDDFTPIKLIDIIYVYILPKNQPGSQVTGGLCGDPQTDAKKHIQTPLFCRAQGPPSDS